MTLYDVLKYLHPNITLGDVIWDGGMIIKWDVARFGSQPTPEQIEAARPLAEKAAARAALQAQLAATDAAMTRSFEDMLAEKLGRKNMDAAAVKLAQDRIAARESLREQLRNLG